MITPETHDHALTCEITTGRGCDCGLTGMAGVEFYMKGEAVYKKPVLRMNPPTAFDVAARCFNQTATEWLSRRRSAAWGDEVDIRKIDAAKLLEILKSQK